MRLTRNILAGTEIQYSIHFQNTGTAPAQHVYIVDTLDSNLELSTFTLIANSHNMTTQLNGNKILFDFVEINLPDSTNDEANSHGYVQYKIKLKPGLSVGSQIRNTARIYYNECFISCEDHRNDLFR